MTNDFVSIVNKEGAIFIIRWDRVAEHFTIEDHQRDYVLIYKQSINDLIGELTKLKEMIDESKPEKKKP